MSANRFRRAAQVVFAAAWTGVVVYLVFLPSGVSAPKRNPLRALAASTAGNRLTVAVHVAPESDAVIHARVELVGPHDKVLQRVKRDIPAGGAPGHFPFVFDKPAVAASGVTVRYFAGGLEREVPLSDILLLKGHETTLFAPSEMIAGSHAALRCGVHGVRSLSETVPLDAAVIVNLIGANKKAQRLATGKTDGAGPADIRFKLPETPGKYQLEVVTTSALGQEKLRSDVVLRDSTKVLLTTDKPLYQPGQTIHLRALALRSFDLLPVNQTALMLEVEDAKGNKVFKKALQTSPFGIAQADFTLADEVNRGDYRIRAILGEHTAEKTVAVKRYVLPKFKLELKTERDWFLPREMIKGTLRADYFFGKPVAGAAVEIKAGAFDKTFKDFDRFVGKTDKDGYVSFEMRLPAWYSGSAVQKSNARIRLEARLTDTAGHTESASLTRPVSDQPIQVSFIPENGRVVPDMENRIFVAALYPDGKPAKCSLGVWLGNSRKDKPFATLTTNESGLAELRLTPKSSQFRSGGARNAVEFIGMAPSSLPSVRPLPQIASRTQPSGGSSLTPGLPRDRSDAMDLTVTAKDERGNRARLTAAVPADGMKENVLVRLDKAIYQAGDKLGVEVRTSAGLPTVCVDVVKSGQPVFMRCLPVEEGRVARRLDLPADVFGTLEVHAYQVLPTGEVIRDTRVAFVNPPGELKVKVSADKPVYRPGAEGVITFDVTDRSGKPAAAALGVLIVDEAVYALQEMQPGLEKVFFALQQELLKSDSTYRPAESIGEMVRAPELSEERQQIARVLLAGVRPKSHPSWQVAPDVGRKQLFIQQVTTLGFVVFDQALTREKTLTAGKGSGVRFAPNLLERLVRENLLNAGELNDPLGGALTLARLAELEPGFTAERLALMVTRFRMEALIAPLQDRLKKRGQWFAVGTDVLLERMMSEAARLTNTPVLATKDGWGREMKLVKRSREDKKTIGLPGLSGFTLISAGPDGKFGTSDDVKYEPIDFRLVYQSWWRSGASKVLALGAPLSARERGQFGMRNPFGLGGLNLAGGGFPGGGLMVGGFAGGGLMMGGPGLGGLGALGGFGGLPGGGGRGFGGGSGPGMAAGAGADNKGAPAAQDVAPSRLREYFPETLLWQPAVITDEKGKATLKVPFADSITTWRLTASASSRSGGLGGTSAPLRVFQDFFVDIDLPVALTQNDEVTVPVAVYNYLKVPYPITLELKEEPWFTLLDGEGKRNLKLQPNQVTAVHFRIRAKKVGHFALTVEARGARLSDAVKRAVAVRPDGFPVEQVHSGQLTGVVKHVLAMPPDRIDGASRLVLTIYPGVYSQILEGVLGMLRMPNGCFEQTSSSAYPNILAMDYLKKNRLASPATLARSERYLAAGYQRLLTFERPGGGFDLWGTGTPEVWLSAYGLQEFNDMAKVWPIDGRIIDRTQNWLMKQQAADGTWSKPGFSKLLLTSYVTWAMLDSMPRPTGWQESEQGGKLKKAIAYIRENASKADNAYVLALCANALASWDAKDDSTFEVTKKVLAKLNEKKKRFSGGAVGFPAEGWSLTSAYGDSLTVETTALAALAMIKNGQFTTTVNGALAHLVHTRGGDGTWGSTQATILAMKALLAGMGARPKGTTPFVVKVAGKEAATGKVTEDNSDVLQQFDLTEHLKTGDNEVSIEVKGETSLLYRVAGRHFLPRAKLARGDKPELEMAVSYDRTKLTTADLLKAKATLKYHGKRPIYQMIVDLPIPPGFTAENSDFARMVRAGKVMRFDAAAQRMTLYLGDVKVGSEQSFEYGLKPKYPAEVTAPPATAYEYYTPANRASSAAVKLLVQEKR
jgi:hypothetical protein